MERYEFSKFKLEFKLKLNSEGFSIPVLGNGPNHVCAP
jgi:hypothetical protein